MNKIFLTGYIASDVDLKATTQGVSVLTFNLAVKRPKTKDDTTDFLTIVCWRNTAEFVSKYFKKGSGIEVSGYLTIRKWQDKDGNNRYSAEIVAEEVDFGKKSRSEENGRQSDCFQGGDFTELDEDDGNLPF